MPGSPWRRKKQCQEIEKKQDTILYNISRLQTPGERSERHDATLPWLKGTGIARVCPQPRAGPLFLRRRQSSYG